MLPHHLVHAGADIQARTSFVASEVLYGRHFGDVLSSDERGRALDYARFHDTVPAPLTWAAGREPADTFPRSGTSKRRDGHPAPPASARILRVAPA